MSHVSSSTPFFSTFISRSLWHTTAFVSFHEQRRNKINVIPTIWRSSRNEMLAANAIPCMRFPILPWNGPAPRRLSQLIGWYAEQTNTSWSTSVISTRRTVNDATALWHCSLKMLQWNAKIILNLIIYTNKLDIQHINRHWAECKQTSCQTEVITRMRA